MVSAEAMSARRRTAVPTAPARHESVASELEPLVGPRDQGALSAEEFEAAKASCWAPRMDADSPHFGASTVGSLCCR